MLGLILQGNTRPNRVTTPEKEKDEDYHISNARWCVYMANSRQYQDHQNRIRVNKNFYSPNRQWMEREDTEAFLMDTSGQTTNRIKTETNMIQSMVNTYIGTVEGMGINARARSFSPLVKVRKEEKLQDQLMWLNVANNSHPDVQDKLQKEQAIGKDKKETIKLFDNIYVDKFVKGTNSLLRYSEVINRFDRLKIPLAEDGAISGIVVTKPVFYNGDLKFYRFPSERFFFDRSSRTYDGSDANYMGDWDEALPTEIFERFPDMDEKDREFLENYANTNMSYNDGRIYVYTVYWRDCIKDEYGYVRDDDDTIFYTRINFETDDGVVGKYTDKDVVQVSELTKAQKYEIGKKVHGLAKRRCVSDQWRYCIFVAAETIGAAGNWLATGDIVLDYGVMPFQEPDVNSPDNMRPPYKYNQYIYIDGNTYSPIDIAINPQRVINRMNSVIENMFNNARQAGTLIDPESLVDDITQVQRDMSQSKAVLVRGRGQGVQMQVGKYDSTVGQGTVILNQLKESYVREIEMITTMNAQMKGQQDSADQLVGVYQLMLKRGSVPQRRFYSMFTCVFEDMYQTVATSGRRYYITNKRKLINAVGDDDAEVIELSEDMKNEDMRVEVKTSFTPEDERKYVDGLILQLSNPQIPEMQRMLDDTRASNLFGRGTEDDLFMAIREWAKEKEIVKQKQAEAQQKQTQMGIQMAGQQQDQAKQEQQHQEQREDGNKQADRENKLHNTLLNNMTSGQGQQQQIPFPQQ